MKNILFIFINKLRACTTCHGMKVIELPGGNTIDCPACKGKGFI